MQVELEAKFLRIDKKKMREKLQEIGAILVRPETEMRRKNFDHPDLRLEAIGGWVRVRDEGDKITLSYKQLNDRSLQGTQEVQVDVSDFDDTVKLLESIGLTSTGYQETKRESWTYNNCEIEIDTWPWIPPLLEIEAPNEELLREVASDLGLDFDTAVHGSVEIAYVDVFDIEETDFYKLEDITFDSQPPEWLEKTRR